MKKIAKLSLVTAVAVAGLTNVNAASLEEAIKGVDVSGQFRFRFQEKNVDGETTGASTNNETNSDVEVEIGVKVPVNDKVTAVFKIDNAGNHKDNSPSGKGDVEIEDYYFSYADGALTVNAGQQNIPGRLTDGAQGDGMVALYNLGAATVGAAAFANHNVDLSAISYNGSQAVYSVIAMGNVGPVSLLGQYATVEDTVDTFGIKADASIEMIKAGIEYTESELDSKTGVAAASLDDRSTLKAYVSGKAGIVSAKLTYAQTGDNGSGAIDSQANSDGLESASEFLLWNLGSSNRADLELFALDASVALTDKVSLRAAYAAGEQGKAAGKDVEEILGQVTYKMSKNLTSYVRYAEYDSNATSDNADGQRGRVEVKYSF
ncbi:porin [Poseidonibacter lekithochrous]|uniref:porin n=1 Tax=Poseidonibacter lekithochrous TaxID=1904463 RepID=UPI0008FCD889|nr:porin [Poseidonibacter lekithochrous]QKJ21726.1 Campylo_MOMP domain-containing protein [Poseidonibacter lekithochrous]